MSVLQGLEPSKFFYYFEEISNIPRCSYNEQQVSDYIANFAKKRGLDYFQDEIHNILVKKPSTPGYENAPALIFHGHTDIVCEKDEGAEHDFSKEGIKLTIDGDFIKAQGTTLGADNTVGVALALSVLDSDDIPHPPLEVILTVQEEVGKAGAQHFDASRVSGKRLLDFNWHDPKSLFAGCAGDISAWLYLPIRWDNAPQGVVPMSLRVKGLTSGHSEFDIHLERANAIMLLARCLNDILERKDVKVAGLTGGVNRYVIPGEAEALVLVRPSDADAVRAIVDQTSKDLKNEFKISDPGLDVAFETREERIPKAFSDETAKTAVRAISLLPNGVQSMSLAIKGLVESSNTVALLETTDERIGILSTIPSAVSSRRYNILKRIQHLAALLGNRAEVTTFADCPEWPYNENSRMLQVCKKAYRDLFGEEPHVEVSHSSLELGLFHKKIPGLDMISIGPEAYDVHTTRERLNYKTVDPVWKLLKEILKNLGS
jgi:dipeptidase D